MKIINFKIEKMKLLTKEQQESNKNEKICYICNEKFENKYLRDEKYGKVRDHCHYKKQYRDAPQRICNLRCSVSKNIPINFHNGSNYDYHFIIKELAEEFKKEIYLFRRNHWKIYNLYSSNRKRSYKNW